MHFRQILIIPGLVTVLFVAACDTQQPDLASLAIPALSTTPAGTPAEAKPADAVARFFPIDLSIKQDMLDELDDVLASLPTALSLATPVIPETAKADNLSLSGKLIIDDDIAGYVESVEGAEINLEIKFR